MTRKRLFYAISSSINDTRKFSIVVSIIVAILAVDVSLSSITSITSMAYIWGVAAFTITVVTYGIGQYFILQFVKAKSKNVRVNSAFFRILTSTVLIVQYIITAIFGLLVLQILLNWYYSTVILNLGSTITYALAAIITSILSSKFFLWYRSKRNFVVLLYGVSIAIISVNMVFILLFVSGVLSGLPSERNPQSQAPDIFLPPITTLGLFQAFWALSFIVSFVCIWSSTVILLHQYSQKLGKVRLWVILAVPLVAQVTIIIVTTPIDFGLPSRHVLGLDEYKFYINIFGLSMPGILAGILFGAPFLLLARSTRHNDVLRDYLIIAGFGLILFEMSAAPLEGTATAPYPPLGFASVLFAGLSSFMILVGLYYSAISISENSSLRRSIRESVMEETKLLDSIGTAHMETEIQNRVISIAKAQANSIAEERGVETALSDEDLTQYLKQVLEEIQHKKDINNDKKDS